MNNEEKWKQEFEEYIKKDIVFMNSYPERDAYLEACKKRQSEIERLEKELQATREQLKKCESALNNYAICDDVGATARRYFQDKQKDEGEL